MKLLEWRKANQKTQEWLAEETGIDQALISRYERGTTPLVPNARKIEKATNGAVTLDDWYPTDEKETPDVDA